jgi:hypothetical protein
MRWHLKRLVKRVTRAIMLDAGTPQGSAASLSDPLLLRQSGITRSQAPERVFRIERGLAQH